MLGLLFAFILGSFGTGAIGIFFLNDDHYPYVTDMPFDYYDYELSLDLPGVWYPYKAAACEDLFIDTWALDSWPCQDVFTVTYTLFKT